MKFFSEISMVDIYWSVLKLSSLKFNRVRTWSPCMVSWCNLDACGGESAQALEQKQTLYDLA